MDPEIESQLNEQIAEMNEILSKQNSVMAAQVKNLNDLVASQKAQTTSTTKAVAAETASINATTGNTKKAEAAAEANSIVERTNTQLAKSFAQGKDALLGFAGAMLDTTPGMAKYATSVKGATEAVGGLAESFGPLGTVASKLLGAMSSLVAAAFNYNDAVVKGYDDVAKLGGAIGSSAEGILDIAHRAGISSQNLEMFTKNAASLGPRIRSLGNSTSEGVAKFGSFIDVGEGTLQQYRKLGYSQDDLIEAQSRYIDIQARTGIDMSKSPRELQRASLQYVDKLNILAEITGVSVKKQQELLDQAMAQENFNAYISGMKARAAAEKDPVEKARLENIIKAKEAYATVAMQFGPEKAKGILEMMSTNGQAVITASSASVIRGMPEVVDQISQLNQGHEQQFQLIQANNESVARYNRQLGDAGTGIGAVSRNIMGVMGQDNESRQMAARYAGKTAEQMQEQYNELQRQQNEKKNQHGGIMDERAQVESQERQARLAFDELLASLSKKFTNMALTLMPKVNDALAFLARHLDDAGKLLKVLGVALGVFAGVAVVGKVVQTVRSLSEVVTSIFGVFRGKKATSGKLGTSNNPVHATIDGTSVITGGRQTPTPTGASAAASGAISGRVGEAAGTAAATAGEKLGGMVGSTLGLGDTASGLVSDVLSEQSESLVGAVGGKLQQRVTGGKGGNVVSLGPITDVASSSSGTKVGSFLEGIVQGLSAAGKPPAPLYITLGAAAVGASITAIGAGLAGATWIMGKALPSFAAGLKAFDELNGPNLQQVGTGMAGLGAGILAMGAGNIADSLSNVVNWFVGGTDPLDEVVKQVKKLEEMTLNTKKVKDNSDAVIAFSKAMASASEIGSSGAMSNAAKGIADSINSYFGGKPPTQQLEDFSKLQIDAKNVRKNAKAFKVFAEAMASYTGFGSPVGAIGAAIAESTTKFFGASPPFTQFVTFSMLPINAAKTKNNATAFKLFSEAMATYKGMGSPIGVISTAMADAAYKFFNVRPPLDQFVYFSHLDIDPKKTSINAKSFVSFSNAMAEYKGGPGLIDTISSLVGKGFGALFGEDGPVEAFKKFTKEDFGPKASENSEAFYKYAQAAGMVAQAGGGSLPGSGGGAGGGGAGGGFGGAVSTGAERGAALGAGAVGAVGGALSSLWESGRSLVTGMSRVSEEDLKKAGLRIKSGDVHGPKYDLDNRIIPFAQKIQQNIPGFKMFTSFNDRFHHGLSYESKHKSGKAVDFVLDKKPTERFGRDLVAALKSAGAAHAIDEYNHPSGASTGGHIHAQFAEKGGIFSGHHQGEMISPLNMNSVLSKLAKLPADNVTTVGATPDTNGSVDKAYSKNVKLTQEIGQKLDELVAVLQDNHSIKTKILQHSRA